MTNHRPFWFCKLLPGVAIILVLAACGQKPKPAPVQSKPPQAGSATPSTPDTATTPTNVGPAKSVFTLGKASRDPFFPKSARLQQADKPATPSSTPPTSVAPAQLPELLQAGLQGIMSVGTESLAVIYNRIVEPGRTTEITVPTPGSQGKTIQVKCRKIEKNTVELEVDGQVITLTRKTAGS